MFHGDLNTRDVEGSKRIQEELGIDKAYGLKMRQVDEESNRGSGPMYAGHKVTTFEGADGRRFERSVWANDNWPGKAEWTEVGKEGPAVIADEGADKFSEVGDAAYGESDLPPGFAGLTTGQGIDESAGAFNPGDWIVERRRNGDYMNEKTGEKITQDEWQTRMRDAADREIEQGGGEEDLGPPNKREGFNRDDWLLDSHSSADDWLNKKTGERYTRLAEPGEERLSVMPSYPWSQVQMPEETDEERADREKYYRDRDTAREQEQQELLGSASPEDLNNPDNWYEFSGKYVYKGPEFGKNINTNPPADTEDWARTRAAAASKTSGASAAPEVYLPPDTFGVGDGGGPSDQERRKADRMERDDYDLSPGIDNVPLDLMQDEYGDIDSYNARMLEVTPGTFTREELAERDVAPELVQQLVNKEVGGQWGDAFQQALSPTARQGIGRPGMTSESGNEMQTMATANAMLGGRMAQQQIPHQFALQHSKKVKDMLGFAHKEGIDMANLLKSDWYSGANDAMREEAINQQIQNAMASNPVQVPTSWR